MDFEIMHLTYEETRLFPKVMMDYANGEAYLAPFYQYKPVITEFKKAIDEKRNIDRKLLAKVIGERYTKNAPDASEFTLKNIKRLEDDNCFTVTTGHQLCLFTGPLYFIYKIASAIELSQRLREEYPNQHFVPVYWMATEDHDFEEINHAYVFGKKVEWTPDKSLIGGPVGSISTETLKPVIENLISIIGENTDTELSNIIREAYTKHKTFAEATFYLVDKLFGKYGLVILDADNAELKRTFIPVITDELVNQSSFKRITETNAKLVKAGVKPEVNCREINLFYIDEKGRNRIEKQGDKYAIIGTQTSFSREEIEKLINQSPEKFSPNVVLRPLYQQAILPNVAYVGGPSEIAYWLQLKGVFNHYKVNYPILMPRNSATVIDKVLRTKMDKLNLTAKDMFKEVEEIVKDYVKQNSATSADFEGEKQELKKVYDEIARKTKEIDPTLNATVEVELQKQYNALKNIETKLLRVQKQKDETSVNQIRKLKDRLFPEGVLQERHDNFIPFYLTYGASFLDILMQNFDPFDFRMVVMSE